MHRKIGSSNSHICLELGSEAIHECHMTNSQEIQLFAYFQASEDQEAMKFSPIIELNQRM